VEIGKHTVEAFMNESGGGVDVSKGNER